MLILWTQKTRNENTAKPVFKKLHFVCFSGNDKLIPRWTRACTHFCSCGTPPEIKKILICARVEPDKGTLDRPRCYVSLVG